MMDALTEYTREEVQTGNDRLTQLATHLETADDHHRAAGERPYDQGTVRHYTDANGKPFERGDPRWHCGSPACAVGHAEALFRDDRLFYDTDTFFALTSEESDELFSSIGCGDAETSLAAAAYIHSFVERRKLELSREPSEEPRQEEGDQLDLVGP